MRRSDIYNSNWYNGRKIIACEFESAEEYDEFCELITKAGLKHDYRSGERDGKTLHVCVLFTE